jgi:elongation factor 1-beta
MGTALITLKLMPASPEIDLEKLKADAQKTVEEGKGTKVRFEEVPIAFGLKAVHLFFDLDESDELEPIENSLDEIENVGSVEMVDMRRAFG